MSAERRLYPRFTLASRFNVLLKPPGSPPRTYRVVNFSRGGLLLLEAQAQPHVGQQAHSPDLKAGQVAQIVFSDTPSTPDDKHALEAAVVRLSDVHVAIRFLDPDSKILDQLHAIVMRHVGTEEARRQVGALLEEVREDLSLGESDEVPGLASSQESMPYLGESKGIQAPGWLTWTIIPGLILLAVALVYLYRLDERLTGVETAAVPRSDSAIQFSSFKELKDEVRVLGVKVDQALSGLSELQQSGVNDERLLVLESHKEHLTQLSSEVDGLKREIQSIQAQAARPITPPAVAAPQEPAQPQAKPTLSWVVYVMSALNEGALAGMEVKLRDLGVKGEREIVTVRGETRHRLLVPGFQSGADAQAFAKQIREQLKLRDTPWVARRTE
ncbi:MAG: PilZ domain-containing protein [Gammaproteobacteria bacterium]|nr:PilZ domain-containing protein [Gammaproteobacteria bacterium]